MKLIFKPKIKYKCYPREIILWIQIFLVTQNVILEGFPMKLFIIFKQLICLWIIFRYIYNKKISSAVLVVSAHYLFRIFSTFLNNPIYLKYSLII